MILRLWTRIANLIFTLSDKYQDLVTFQYIRHHHDKYYYSHNNYAYSLIYRYMMMMMINLLFPGLTQECIDIIIIFYICGTIVLLV